MSFLKKSIEEYKKRFKKDEENMVMAGEKKTTVNVKLKDDWNVMPEARRSGRTTRAINEAIEVLFQRKETTIIDHHGTGTPTRFMASKMIERLYKEHNLKRENLTIRESEYGVNIKLNSP